MLKQIDTKKHISKNESDRYEVVDIRSYNSDFDSDDSVDNENLTSLTNSKREILLSYAHPLIVVEYERLETCYDQLKEIINENNIEFDDEALVKSIVTHDYDLNSVLLNDVFNND